MSVLQYCFLPTFTAPDQSEMPVPVSNNTVVNQMEETNPGVKNESLGLKIQPGANSQFKIALSIIWPDFWHACLLLVRAEVLQWLHCLQHEITILEDKQNLRFQR